MSIKRNDSFLDLRKQAEKMLKGRRVEEADLDFEELIQELEVHQVELELQNEELRRTQKELEASRNEYFSLYNSSPFGFVTVGDRIVQESLTNAVKHAEAEEVFITLSCRNGTIYLSVEDDGKGFNYDSRDENGVRQGHLGISIMKERASEFDGEFRLETSPGKGTQTTVELPVQEPA